MPFYLPEPPYRHGAVSKIGILLVNLGTPDAPRAAAVRPYLKQFLSDRRVVEIPRLLWWLILNGIILRVRPKKSAAKYALIWTEHGSPLLHHTRQQALRLQQQLSARSAAPLVVEFGMRYGNPSVTDALHRLKAHDCDRILVIPLYPQYAASSSASALDAVWNALLRMRNVPEIRTLRSYHDHPAYIQALAESVRQHWAAHGHPDKLLISFHGVPQYTLDKGDPYHCLCHKTGRLLAENLGLSAEQYQVAFQSRFGRAEWIKPYTQPTLEAWAQSGVGRVDVICPGFAADCLETLEEINMECRSAFLSHGGKSFHYIPALNAGEAWIDALATIASQHLQGWVDPQYNAEQAQRQAECSRQHFETLRQKQQKS